MSFSVSVFGRGKGRFVASLSGHLDSSTAPECEEKIFPLLVSSTTSLLFDMAGLSYISSAGFRILLIARKSIEGNGGEVLVSNLQPQIKKLFDIIKALPEKTIFASVEEADQYLDMIQKKELERQRYGDNE